MEIILSIKPQFAELIFNGEKKYEFRRSIFRNENVTKVIVYASSPISKVIGEFEIAGILKDEIDNLRETTQQYSGISNEFYKSYFQGKEKGYAIKIQKPKRYKDKMCIKEFFGINAPQSFAYVKDSILSTCL